MSTVEVNLSAAAAAADGVQVLLAGWGMKEGGMFKTWRRRFFVLRNRLPGEHLGDWLGRSRHSGFFSDLLAVYMWRSSLISASVG